MNHITKVEIFALGAALFGAAYAGPVPGRGEPTSGFTAAIETSLQEHLSTALVEMAFGDPAMAKEHAGVAALPERLTVYFDASQLDWGRGGEMTAWAREALEFWNNSGTARFEEVSYRGSADIVVQFSDRVHGSVGVYAGYATSRRSASYGAGGLSTSLSANVEISNRAPGGRLTNREQVRKAVAHEFGHVLGLEDTKNSSHLMGPVAPNGGEYVGLEARAALVEMGARARAILDSAPGYTPQNGVPKIFTFAK